MATKKKAADKKPAAKRKNFKKEILNSLDAVFDKSVEELMELSGAGFTIESKDGVTIPCAKNDNAIVVGHGTL